MTQHLPFANEERTVGLWQASNQVSSESDLARLGRGKSVDQQLKQLMKELGEAINESLSDSEQIAEVVSRIKEGGYDIFLVLEATIGVSKQGEKPTDKTSLVTTLSTNPEFKISEQDLKFLKSLRIKIEDEK
jgi:pentose-5-phosphate-3-epimerase